VYICVRRGDVEFAFHGYMYQSFYTYLLACLCVLSCVSGSVSLKGGGLLFSSIDLWASLHV